MLRLVDEKGVEVQGPYLLRMSGWTEERYFREAPESRLCEFDRGVLIMHSPVNRRHADLTEFVGDLVSLFVDAKGLGTVLRGPAVVRFPGPFDKEPDIFFFRHGRESQEHEQYVDAPVDLIVEVLSPGTREYDLDEKRQLYEEHGVVEYWVVDDERRELLVHRRPGSGLPYGVRAVAQGWVDCPAVPGFRINVEWLWRDPLPSKFACLQEILAAPR